MLVKHQSNIPWRWNMKADPKPKKEAQANVPVAQKVQREIIAWFWVALVFLLINGTIGQARVIPSGSMENTLLIGDHLIMSRIGCRSSFSSRLLRRIRRITSSALSACREIPLKSTTVRCG